MTMECLDEFPLTPRMTPGQIRTMVRLVATVPANQNRIFYKMQNDIKAHVGINVFDPVRLPGLSRQVYWPAVFELEDDEALITETEMPKRRPYWNIQSDEPMYNAAEYVQPL